MVSVRLRADMLEARGRVIAIEQGLALVESVRQSACGSCSSKGHCGTGLMGDALAGSGHVSRIHVQIDMDVQTGDEVIIGLPEEGMLQASLLLYGLPLLGLIGGMIATQPWGEGVAITAGVIGLLAGMALVRPLSRRLLRQHTQPRILSRIERNRVPVCPPS